MDYFGYTGKIAIINLSNFEFNERLLTSEEINQFIGGFGVNIKLMAEFSKPHIDPFSENNPIIIGTGPLVGTIIPGSSRTVATTKFPASGAIATVCGSMSFGFNLKNAGFDHLVLYGRAKKPTILQLINNKIKFLDASELWGKDIVETNDYLKEKYGQSGVIAIGQAGENLVKQSMALIDKTATLGRAGLAAVMGSKKLKAIQAIGCKGIKLADSKTFWTLYNELHKRIEKYPLKKEWQKLGLMRSLPVGMALAARGENEKSKECNNKTYLKKLKKRRIACPSCPIGDKDILEIKEGKYQGLITYTSSVVNAFNLLLLKDLIKYDDAVKAFDVMNRYGLDALTMVALVEFCTDLYEKGIITEIETGIKWKKDFETLMKISELIVNRKGFGNILADGWGKLAELYDDIEKDMLVIKGLETVIEPRLLRLGTMEFEQVVNPKGSHIASGGSPTYFAPGKPLNQFKTHFYRMGIPENAIKNIFQPPIKEMGLNIGRLTRYSEDWYTILTSLGLCGRAQINRFYSLKSVTEFYNAVTGLNLSEETLRKAAERSWNLLKILNVREGFSKKDDKFPDAWFQSMKFGKLELKLLDFYGGLEITPEISMRLINDYYDERGWDVNIGIPTKEKISELNLNDF
ncbi:MAG: hypothetical protein EAX96_09085 [Candidatus Lokiarchaeota archaeon]|nr:hypothetical protein [Candidatus Lokiarchaeota archaeon]